MAGRVTVLTPVDHSDAIELGRSTWRKQILPVGQLDYSGRKLNFTREYLNDIVASFKARAFDAVPLQLADASNSHTNDVTRAAGEVIGLEATDEGLFATVSATDKGSEILREHPNLGVSVRLVEDYVRQDGRSSTPHRTALQHVLGTWAPRVAGMKAWEPIDCAQETTDVIDLSALVFTADGNAVSPSSTANPGDQQVPSIQEAVMAPVLTEEELAAIRAVLPILPKLVTDEAKPDDKPEPTAEVKPDATVTQIKPAPKPAEGADADPEAEQTIAAAVGDGEDKVVDLAVVELRSVTDRQAIELAELRAERDQEKWNYESEQLVRDYGIPPAIVTLAEPLLKGARHVVELSDGTNVDAGAVVRSILTTVAKTYGKRVDLSAPTGSAQGFEADADAEAKAEQQRIHEAARAARFGH